jgi:hypothetical protein
MIHVPGTGWKKSFGKLNKTIRRTGGIITPCGTNISRCGYVFESKNTNI